MSVAEKSCVYRNLPIKGASPNKGAPYSLEEPSPILADQNQHSFFNNCPIFNPKPPFESVEPQLCLKTIRSDLARASGTLIRQNTVFNNTVPVNGVCFAIGALLFIVAINVCK